MEDLAEILPPSEIEELRRKINSRLKSKTVTLLLHIFAAFWAPLFYLGRPGAAILTLIGPAVILFPVFISGSLNALGPIVPAVTFAIWLLGFSYFSREVDRINVEIPAKVVHKYLGLRER